LDRQRAQRAGRHGDWTQATRPARPAAPPTAVPAAQGLDVQAGIGGQSGLLRVSRPGCGCTCNTTSHISMAAFAGCCFQRVYPKKCKKKCIVTQNGFYEFDNVTNCKEICKYIDYTTCAVLVPPVNSRALRSQGALFMPLAGPFTLHEMLCKHMPHQSANKMVYIHLQFVLLAGPTRSAQ